MTAYTFTPVPCSSLFAFRQHAELAVNLCRARLALPRRVHVVVAVEPALAVGMSARSVAKLERGITLERTDAGVVVHGLPGLRRSSSVASMSDAVMLLHALADTQADIGERSGGLDTATGCYARDRAALLREVARVVVQHRRVLWPGEPCATPRGVA